MKLQGIIALIMLAVAVFGQIVSWVPPHAQLVGAYVYNATHFAYYKEGKAVYIAQEGLTFNGTKSEAQAVLQFLYSQCKYVAVEVKNVTLTGRGELWPSEVYCSQDGSSWLWLRLLPLRFAAYKGAVDFVNASITVYTPIGVFTGYVPAGWYLDRGTNTVFRLPGFNASLITEIHKLQTVIAQLTAQLQAASANNSQLSALLTQLSAKARELESQRKALEEAVRHRESVISALSAQLQAARAEADALRKQLEEARRENEVLKAKLSQLNATYADKISQLQLQLNQLSQMKLQAQEEGGPNLLPILFIALIAIVGALVYIRKKRAEE
ncbi:hypothetical protein [Pyrobaculum aerophilum]|uniref:Uncharacterized protein n=1 Tax=Pyrobaculum aerophilum TaxID=13773 RepID=A0A371QUL0_9CREN|nr:hypothetical protein [Pyrobaculum aerophilum]RFA93033.1 hypothetical protein CGL51_13700 [Pyrobaculum aerophilum]RFA97763.1 hypothetical protein CGL52_08440 [Pyrobaculum aerophilum]